MGVQDLVAALAGAESGGLTEVQTRLETRYYTANVRLRCLDAESCSASVLMAAEAIVLFFDLASPETFRTVTAFYECCYSDFDGRGDDLDAEIRLCLAVGAGTSGRKT